MVFNEFINWAFLGVVSGGVYILWQVKENISQLNTKMEVLVNGHEIVNQTVKDHEARLRDLEKHTIILSNH